MRTFIEISVTSYRVFLHCMHFYKDKDCAYQIYVKDERCEWEAEMLSVFIYMSLCLELNELIVKEFKEYIYILRRNLNLQTA